MDMGSTGTDYTGDDWESLAEDREVWRAYVHAAMNYGFDSASELVCCFPRCDDQ